MCRRFGRPWLVATALSLSIVIGAAVAFASMNEQTTSEHRILQYRHLQECRGPGDGCVRGARYAEARAGPVIPSVSARRIEPRRLGGVLDRDQPLHLMVST